MKKSVRRVSTLLFVFASVLLRAELPPDAREAVKKGIIAAQQQDYLLAVRYFEDARKIAPNASELYYDLGLAESKIPGRELRAICWFQAYLVADTNATNAAAVKDEINKLDVKNQSNISHLIKSLQDSASQVRHETAEEIDQYNQNLGNVAGLWAWSGDITAAVKINNLLKAPAGREWVFESQRRNNLVNIAKIQGNSDVAGAIRTADLIQDLEAKNIALNWISINRARAGDIAGAQKMCDLLQEDDHHRKSEALKEIADAQAQAGDIAEARKTADMIQAPSPKGDAQKDIDARKKDIADGKLNNNTANRQKVNYQYWLDHLDETQAYLSEDFALNTEPFLDLGSYLTAQHSEDPQKMFDAISAIITTVVMAQYDVDRARTTTPPH